MNKGFVSLLFLLALAQIGIGLHALQNQDEESGSIPARALALKRGEIEMGADALIRHELHRGITSHLPPDEVKTRIHQTILDYLNELTDENGSFSFEIGIGNLNQTNYLSLLSQHIQPVTADLLNQYAHVLILPINQSQEYGEYSYTGGLFGTHILVVKIKSGEEETLFALPSGYHACTTTWEKNIPCLTP